MNRCILFFLAILCLSFVLKRGGSTSFKLLKDGMQPFVIRVVNGITLEELTFDLKNANKDYHIVYEKDMDNPYLSKLRAGYPVDSIAASAKTDIEKIRKIASWVHGLWQHDGMNEPEQNDALYILGEVEKGRCFRCVEYGIVTTACLNSIGIKARTLSLKTKDCETRPSGAGHVLLEAYVNDLDKWIMIDPQYDIIPHLFGLPLNAVEFQDAITKEKPVDVWTTDNIQAGEYIPWIYPYLYYFSVNFDNREYKPDGQKTINGKSALMLVPVGGKNPEIFQKRFPLDYCIYTHSLLNFYANPQ